MDFEMIGLDPEDLPDISELPDDLQIMAEIPGVGVETALRIAMRFKGTPIRTGGLKTLLLKIRDRKIKRESDAGKTVLFLARKHNRDPRTISKILKKPDEEPVKRQLNLWDQTGESP